LRTAHFAINSCGDYADGGEAFSGHAYRDALEVACEEAVPMLEPRGGGVRHTDDEATFRFYGPAFSYIAGRHRILT
jgi:hypothetical protein